MFDMRGLLVYTVKGVTIVDNGLSNSLTPYIYFELIVSVSL